MESWFAYTLSWPWQLVTIPITFLYANWFEWVFHKYVLHGLGSKPNSPWRFHWQDHHKYTRRNGFYDHAYQQSLLKWNSQTKELFALTLGGLIHLPILFFSPLSYATLVGTG